MVHVFNSVIMLIDLMIVGHPIKLSHAYWTLGIGIIYSIFSAVYFLAGGTTRYVENCIFPISKFKSNQLTQMPAFWTNGHVQNHRTKIYLRG